MDTGGQRGPSKVPREFTESEVRAAGGLSVPCIGRFAKRSGKPDMARSASQWDRGISVPRGSFAGLEGARSYQSSRPVGPARVSSRVMRFHHSPDRWPRDDLVDIGKKARVWLAAASPQDRLPKDRSASLANPIFGNVHAMREGSLTGAIKSVLPKFRGVGAGNLCVRVFESTEGAADQRTSTHREASCTSGRRSLTVGSLPFGSMPLRLEAA
ncbi:MAG: hypothetical protein AW08_03924 [Candidatus Accumulibacter adjunctus]|uniref:Uncharacterized protein n=1 Tax=Candidatus Accumulibacter adjunctus TaxID=1454001 RepID=A0A011NGK8_9PROT|nr:MAG: hypothetical protein AW08_03924 [Candidatus Accumulibacter adjunctus]